MQVAGSSRRSDHVRHRPHSADLTQRRVRRPADQLGRANGHRARAGDRHDHHPRPSQCDRHSQRLVWRLPGAGGRGGRAVPRAQGRSHEHVADGRPRPVPAVEPARQDRRPRSMGRTGGRRVRRRVGRRLRHPSHHRRDQGACDLAGDRRRRTEGAPSSGWPHAAAQWCGARHQGGDRAGMASAWRGATFRLQRDGSAPRAVRGDRRHVSRTRHALGPRGVPAADRWADDLHLRHRPRSCRSRRRADCARA